MDIFISAADLEMWLQPPFNQSDSIDRVCFNWSTEQRFQKGQIFQAQTPPSPQPTLIHD